MSKLKEHKESNKEDPISTAQANDVRLPYTSPRILSAEQLEAAAFACDPPAAGKSSGAGCGTQTQPFSS